MRSDTGPFSIVPNWLIEVVSPTAVVVYIKLSSYADNETLKCWPSHKEIAEGTGMSVSTVQRAIKELQENAALEVNTRRRSDGSYTSSEYVLLRIDPQSRVTGGGVTSAVRSSHTWGEVQSPVTEQEELYPFNYTHLTIPNELDIASEKISSAKDPPKRPPDLIFEAVCEVCGINPRDLTKTQRGPLNRAVKELKDVKASPQDIFVRAQVFQALWPSIKLTPMALASRWAECTIANIENLVTKSARDNLLDQIEQHKRYATLEQKAIGQ